MALLMSLLPRNVVERHCCGNNFGICSSYPSLASIRRRSHPFHAWYYHGCSMAPLLNTWQTLVTWMLTLEYVFFCWSIILKIIHSSSKILEVAQGLEYLHSQNIVHGDLRGVSGSTGKLGDYLIGCSSLSGQYSHQWSLACRPCWFWVGCLRRCNGKYIT